MTVSVRRHAMLLAIATVYLGLAIALGVTNPLFEAPDEHKHYFVVQRVAEERRLPFYNEAEPDPWTLQEAAQPPLYYLIGSLLVDPAAVAGARNEVWPNSFARIGDAGIPSNRNAFIHGPAEAWPWTGYAAAAHRLRLLSTLLGLGTVVAVYATARALWPRRRERAVVAAGLVAFLPQFLFIHAAVTNDALITFLSTAVLWQVARLWTRPPGERVADGMLLALGVTAGLAALTKNQGAALIPYAWLGVTAVARRRGLGLKGWLRWSLLFLAPALAAAGWLWWRNWTLYGDPTAASVFVSVAGGSRDFSVGEALAEWPGLVLSSIGVFGWFNVLAARWVYWVWLGLGFLGLVGVLGGLVARRRRAGGVVFSGSYLGRRRPIPRLRSGQGGASLQGWLGGWVVVVVTALLLFLLETTAAQGRLLFPALLPVALGVARGLDAGAWRRARPLFLAAALATAVYTTFITIPAAYRPPPAIATADIPAGAARLDADLGDGIRLLAAEVGAGDFEPGDFVPLTLYWQATEPLAVPADKDETRDYVVELFGREDALVGKLQSYPGAGLYPAELWPVGTVVVERTAVPLDDALATPTRARLNLKWADSDGPGVTLGAAKVSPVTWPAAAGAPLARLGDGVLLWDVSLSPAQAAPGDVVTVDVIWRVATPPGADLTTFVHLGPPREPPLTTGDSPPLGGHYPTNLWAVGEVIEDTYTLQVPEGAADGRYPIRIGLYDPATLVRLPLVTDEGRVEEDAFVVGVVKVERE